MEESALGLLIGASLSAIALAIAGYRFCKRESANDGVGEKHHTFDEYAQMADEIQVEKAFMLNKLCEIADKQKQTLSYSRNKLFSSNNQPQKFSSEILEYKELVVHAFQALQTYPEFIVSQEKEAGYIAYRYIELQEHHIKTKQIVGELFSRIEDTEYQIKNALVNFV